MDEPQTTQPQSNDEIVESAAQTTGIISPTEASAPASTPVSDSTAIPSNTYSDPPVEELLPTDTSTQVAISTPDSDPVAEAPSEPAAAEVEPTESVTSESSSPDSSVPVIPAPEAEAANTSDTSNPVAPSNDTAPNPPTVHHDAPVMAIVSAIVIAAALAGLIIFFYTHSKDGAIKSNNEASNSSPQTETTAAAKTTDIDEASKALDTSLSAVDDNKDFPSNNLSDATLGL